MVQGFVKIMFALFYTPKFCGLKILFLMEQKVSTLFLVQINYSSGYVFNLKHEICFDLSLQIRSRAKQIVLNSQNEY